MDQPESEFASAKLSAIVRYCVALGDSISSSEHLMITRSSVLKRSGWNAKKLDELYPNPELAKNPHYACAAPMKLYDLRKIESLEVAS